MLDRFWTVAKQDPEEIWIGLCQPTEAVRAAKFCEAFLHTYATRTRKRRICLGPEEYELRRSVTTATTLLMCWRSLVTEFDQTLLERKRREDPDNMRKRALKFKDGFITGKGQRPVAKGTRVRLPLHTQTRDNLGLDPTDLASGSGSLSTLMTWDARTSRRFSRK